VSKDRSVVDTSRVSALRVRGWLNPETARRDHSRGYPTRRVSKIQEESGFDISRVPWMYALRHRKPRNPDRRKVVVTGDGHVDQDLARRAETYRDRHIMSPKDMRALTSKVSKLRWSGKTKAMG
jgi:hypothetical protein